MQKYGPKEGLKKFLAKQAADKEAAAVEAATQSMEKGPDYAWLQPYPRLVRAVDHLQVELTSVADLIKSCRYYATRLTCQQKC